MKRKIVSLLLCGALALCPVAASGAETNYNDPALIKEVQEALIAAGYDCGTPDGISGPGTQGQIQKYRQDHGLSDSTAIDKDLTTALGIEQASDPVSDPTPLEFIPCSGENRVLAASVNYVDAVSDVLKKIGAPVSEATITDFGNYKATDSPAQYSLFEVDCKVEMASGKILLVHCVTLPNETYPYIHDVKDMNTGLAYYDDDGGEIYKYENESPDSSKSASTEKVTVEFYSSVKNDVTGKWRLAIVDTSIPVNNYVVSYYNTYFKSDDELHGIINKHDGTTTAVSVMRGVFSITVHKYVPGEENDADLLFSGDVISDGYYNMQTGQIENF